MDFDFTEEQRLLRDSVGKLFASRYADFEKRKAYAKLPEGFDRAVWAEYAEAGLLALPFDEAQGGFGGGPVETMIVMEEIGKALALEPYLAAIVFAGAVLRHGSSAAVRDEVIPALAAGETIVAVAHTERSSRHDLEDVTTTAKRDGDHFILEGEKSVVLGGDTADWLIVSARLAGSRRDRDGIGSSAPALPAAGATATGSACSWSMRRPKASPAAAIRCRTCCAARKSRSPACGFRPRGRSAISRCWSARATRRSPPSAPRRWARWRPWSA